MNYMVIGHSTISDDIYFGGSFKTEKQANERLNYIKDNFCGYRNGLEKWMVHPYAEQPVNFNSVMVFKIVADEEDVE